MSRLPSASRAWVIPLFLSLGGASACEAIVGLGAYSEGAAGDASVTRDAGRRDSSASHHGEAGEAGAARDAATRTEAASCTTCSDSGACACGAGLTCGPKGACVQCATASECEPPTCAAATCTGGGCLYMPAAERAPCGDGGLCTTSGACVECLMASDCPMSVNGCSTPSCSVVTGACGFTFVGSGSACGGQGHCDGRGNCNECSCATPPPCTLTTCDGGCGREPAPRGTSCDASGPGVCTGVGVCAECNFATDCPSPTKVCTVATCEANKCGTTSAPANTACGAAGSNNVCNGTGACVECTANHTTACDGGAPYCGPNGTCVACTSPSQCKGGILPMTCLNNTCVGL